MHARCAARGVRRVHDRCRRRRAPCLQSQACANCPPTHPPAHPLPQAIGGKLATAALAAANGHHAGGGGPPSVAFVAQEACEGEGGGGGSAAAGSGSGGAGAEAGWALRVPLPLPFSLATSRYTPEELAGGYNPSVLEAAYDGRESKLQTLSADFMAQYVDTLLERMEAAVKAVPALADDPRHHIDLVAVLTATRFLLLCGLAREESLGPKVGCRAPMRCAARGA